jgi:amino acid adenylation domain-containing protein
LYPLHQSNVYPAPPNDARLDQQQVDVLPNPVQALYSDWHGAVQARFSWQAHRVPERPAIVDPDEVWSYAELNARSNQLANYLCASGIQPQEVVAIYGHRSASLVWALLGVLKAGAAFLILDSAYPASRLIDCLRLAKPRGLIQIGAAGVLSNMLEEFVATLSCCCRVELPRRTTAEACGLFSDYATADPRVAVGPDDLFYVVFTSGSTGKPKGVLGGHRPVSHFLDWYSRTFGLNESDRFSMLSGLSHDPLLRDIFTPLWLGATLYIPSLEDIRSPGRLADWMKRQKLSITHLTPAMGQLLTEATPKTPINRQDAALPSLRYACFGGDLLTKSDVFRLRALAPAVICVNFYGTTETPQTMGYFIIPNEKDLVQSNAPTREELREAVPLGRGIQDVQLLVLNDNRQLAGIGEVGEIYVRTTYLTKGYIDDEALTQERFIINPFTNIPDDRLYKTGDLARYRPDGNIEFLGRSDDQVKLHGFRIELGEIVAVLSQHSAVREAVVIVREDIPGEGRLVAYLVPASAQVPTTSELRRFLQARLPDYMVPSAFVFLPALPLTPNGKVDRQTLPPPYQARPELENAYVAPRTELERFLANMWREILGIESIGVHDKFFELGGDSIRGAVFINRLQEKLGEIIYVVVLFDAPNIAELAAYLNKHYPLAVLRICNADSRQSIESGRHQTEKVDFLEKVTQTRQLILPLPPRVERDGALTSKNPPAVFSLSPPRSGSTLFRVMLAGHPLLFAPQELELLSFNTLAERKAALSGRQSFRLEGTIRAIMEIKGCDAEQAKRLMEDCENQRLTTQQFYRLMQTWIGERILVDKTPSYALDLETLKRAEIDFDNALFIHLIRHPYGMICSFEEARLDQVFFRYKHPFSARELAELIWLVSHQNILQFLKQIPDSRQYRVKFEDLVNQPKSTLEGICQFLGLEFHPDMLQPYKDKEKKMTDGIYSVSKMLGDVKFHGHKDIDAGVADRWRKYYTKAFLGDITWEVAELLGYENLASSGATKPLHSMPQVGDDELARMLDEVEGLSEDEARSHLSDLQS